MDILTLVTQAMLGEHILEGECLAANIAHIGLLLLVGLDVPLHVLGALEPLGTVRAGVRTILLGMHGSVPLQSGLHVEPLAAAAALKESGVLAFPLLLQHPFVVRYDGSARTLQVLRGHVVDQIRFAGEGLAAQHALTPLDGSQVLPVPLQHVNPFLRIGCKDCWDWTKMGLASIGT